MWAAVRRPQCKLGLSGATLQPLPHPMMPTPGESQRHRAWGSPEPGAVNRRHSDVRVTEGGPFTVQSHQVGVRADLPSG